MFLLSNEKRQQVSESENPVQLFFYRIEGWISY